jgi:hypothetical protein
MGVRDIHIGHGSLRSHPIYCQTLLQLKKSNAYNFSVIFVIPMDNIQCICLFSPNVHLHMLASEKFGLVTGP